MLLRRRLIVILSAVTIALLGCEAALRLFAPQSLGTSWLTTSERGYALNRRSTTTVQTMPGRSAVYHINSLGFRGAEPVASRTRVLAIGDSATFGLLLDEDDTYVSQLAGSAAAKWGPAQASFMNAAVGGWGTGDYTAFIEDQGDNLRPDVVLVFIGFDDVRRAWLSPIWSLAADGGIARQSPAKLRPGIKRFANLPGYRYLIERSHLAQLMRQAVIASPLTHPVRRIDPALRPAAVKFTEGLFARLAEWCRSRSITLLVTNGNFLEFAAKPQAPGATAMFIETAAGFFARLGVPYLSVARAHGPLAGPPQSLEIPDDGHPNERGARLIADAVWPWLNEQLQPIVEPRTISQPDM